MSPHDWNHILAAENILWPRLTSLKRPTPSSRNLSVPLQSLDLRFHPGVSVQIGLSERFSLGVKKVTPYENYLRGGATGASMSRCLRLGVSSVADKDGDDLATMSFAAQPGQQSLGSCNS